MLRGDARDRGNKMELCHASQVAPGGASTSWKLASRLGRLGASVITVIGPAEGPAAGAPLLLPSPSTPA